MSMTQEPILEIIYDYYNEHCGYYTEEAQEGFEQLKQLLEKLLFEEGDQILSAAIVLCAAHEKAGFLAGIKYGYRLARELRDTCA